MATASSTAMSSGETRFLSVRVPEDLHRRVRLMAADRDESIQDIVARALVAEVEKCDVSAATRSRRSA